MNVEFFVKQIAMNKDKEGYIKDRVKKKYVPYEEKMARCEQIINITSYIEVNGEKRYRINTPLKFIFTTLTLINEYTDIDIDFTDGGFLRDFNLLDQNELIEEVIACLPRHEYDTWMLLLKMMSDDKQENERSLVSYLTDKFETFATTLDTTLTALAELSKEESE